MKNYRIFVEKHPRFRVEAESLRRELNANLNTISANCGC